MTQTDERRVSRRRVTLAALVVCAAAIVPYLPTIDDYFVRDDFGVVQLLAHKPATYFPRWFYTSWMDHIWGYTPDEIRPFPAVSYQLTALGGAASPVLHHVVNIALHAANGVLVMAMAMAAASLSLRAAAFAGVMFVLLPVHTESVAWITGRVDSMPAFFYFASFLAFVRWRERGSSSLRLYLWSVAIFFVALFTKQNTITMVGTLVAYDVLVRRAALTPIVAFVWPYVPFGILTVGYLYLRYLLFGEVAREGTLNAKGLADFAALFNRHLAHVVIGEHTASRVAAWLIIAGVMLVALWLARKTPLEKTSAIGSVLYFGPVWWLIGVAPVMVAGYASPRHVYLAAAGWAIVVAIVLDRLANRRGVALNRVAAAAVIIIALYLVPLYGSLREWTATAAVSQKAVRDLRGAALAAPAGSLVIAGAPTRSWDWALPFAARPPFTRTNLYDRVFIISPRSLSCCTAPWFEETRTAIREWSRGNGRDSAVVLRWDPDSGALTEARSADLPQLTVLTRSLADLERPEDLDKNLLRMIDVFTGR
ncbi:MAG TPA: hypothetical protein VFJ02_25725 [Vicinamibacterales bacterium]|nr:hypothetical protein [Vicinamibacterales bacterium]